jgi:hypothetical protein
MDDRGRVPQAPPCGRGASLDEQVVDRQRASLLGSDVIFKGRSADIFIDLAEIIHYFHRTFDMAGIVTKINCTETLLIGNERVNRPDSFNPQQPNQERRNMFDCIQR